MKYNNFLKKLHEEAERDTKMGAVAKIKIKDPDDEVEEGFIGAETEVKVHMNVGAGVIVKQDENNTIQILLIQREEDDHWPNYWEFPRGKCDKPIGEDLLKCTKREVKEETGLNVTPKFLIDIIEYLADKGTRKSKCHNFLCIMNNPDQEIKLSKEHQKYKWISEVGEAEMLLLPDQKKTIEKVLNSDRSIVSYPENDFTKNNEIEEILIRYNGHFKN